MERSWMKRAKQKASGRLFAVKNLSMGWLLVGKGHVPPGEWATNLTEWEMTRRGFLANPKTEKWLCVSMEEYQAMKHDAPAAVEAAMEMTEEATKVEEATEVVVEESTAEESTPEETAEEETDEEATEVKPKKRRGRRKKKAEEEAE